jgi:hypothetical protein
MERYGIFHIRRGLLITYLEEIAADHRLKVLLSSGAFASFTCASDYKLTDPGPINPEPVDVNSSRI